MKTRCALLLVALALAGCATFDQKEIARVRAQGVSEPVVAKLDRGRPLQPWDVIELTRRRVPDDLIVRQIESCGLQAPLQRADVVQLRKAGVHPEVMAALRRASYEQAARWAYGTPYGDPFFDWPYSYGPWGYYGGYPYGWYGVGVVYGGPHYHHYHHHWR